MYNFDFQLEHHDAVEKNFRSEAEMSKEAEILRGLLT